MRDNFHSYFIERTTPPPPLTAATPITNATATAPFDSNALAAAAISGGAIQPSQIESNRRLLDTIKVVDRHTKESLSKDEWEVACTYSTPATARRITS